jgi:predicted nucleotidyltransferase
MGRIENMIDLEKLRANDKLKEICKQYNVKALYVFGSVAKKSNNKESDLDLLVEFSGKKNLFKIIQLSQHISDLFQIDIDLVTKEALSKYLIDKIEKEKEIIYEQ